ncbi:universal stress protein [Streptomyces nondiastaticus]|uniref:universal stress protein n=1 Tax=Streptomyces nondiastaticus TaxID=3154512 RepID=UPI00343235F6
MAQPVSVGVDGSPESLAAAMWAGREATLRDGSLRIVYALEWRTSDQQFSPGLSAQREWAESRFEALAEELLDSGPVVAGLGHHDPHGPLLDFAFEAAALRSTVLRLVRTAGRTPAGDREPHDASALAASLRPCRALWPAVEVEEWFSTGPAVPHLLEASDDAQLLVVGRRENRPFPVTRIGPVTHGVLHHARCPVAVIPSS